MIQLLLTGLALVGFSQALPPLAQAKTLPTVTLTARSVQIQTISFNQLPVEARQTIYLIQQGGPFPYRQDGATFGNREGRLPKAARGYYREYTVPTPGSSDRGARRIVTGGSGEIFYTSDHYRSFFRVRMN